MSFDLRFIPHNTEFDDKPGDERASIPADLRPSQVVTDALQHSEVKPTRDAEETSRKGTINKAFTGSHAEIGKNDSRAHLGSNSESNYEEDDEEDSAADSEELDDEDDTPKFIKERPR